MATPAVNFEFLSNSLVNHAWILSLKAVRKCNKSEADPTGGKCSVYLCDWPLRWGKLDKGGVQLPWRPYWIMLTVFCWNLWDFVLANLCVVQNSVLFSDDFHRFHYTFYKSAQTQRWTKMNAKGNCRLEELRFVANMECMLNWHASS